MPPDSPSALTSEKRNRTGFPLASLLLLVTVCASLLMCIDIDHCRRQFNALLARGDWSALVIFGGSAIFGGVVGFVFSILRQLDWRSVLLALIVGICAGK